MTSLSFYNKARWLIVFLVFLILIVSPLMALPKNVEAASPDYIVDGNSVFVNSNGTYIRVTPHTLNSSGWVTVQFSSSTLTGDVDVCFGFNGLDQIKTVSSESWQTYEHTLTRQVDAVLTAVYQPVKVYSVKASTATSFNVNTASDSLNAYKSEVVVDEFESDNKSIVKATRIIAYNSYDSNTGAFTYSYYGKKSETYKDTFADWKKNVNSTSVTTLSHKNAAKWHSVKSDQPVVKDALYTTRFWIDLPFKGKTPINGKYNVAIKPASLTLQESINQGKIAVLDPWYSASWQYRKAYSISRAAGVVTNYQWPLKIYYGAGTDGTEAVEGLTAGKMYCDSLCQADFDDIRVTNSDGQTLQDIWLEIKTDSNNAIFWIEHDSIGVGATTFYVYYGNATATSVSNGANTFIDYEDFEWGVDGTNVNTSGGSITWTTILATCQISTDRGYTGTRSLKIVGAATNPECNFPLIGATGTYAARMRVYKEDATNQVYVSHGASDYFSGYYLRSTEDVYYRNNFSDTGFNVTANVWQLFELNDLDFTAHTHDIWMNGSSILNGGAMYNANWHNDHVAFATLATGAGNDVYFDNCIVRNWRSTEPAWGTWGSAEPLSLINTLACTGFGSTYAIVNGQVVTLQTGTITIRAFDYGLTTAYTNEVTEVGAWTTAHSFSAYLSGLTPATLYHYRAKVYISGVWYYGQDMIFSTKGSPVEYEYLATGATTGSYITGTANMTYQTFTTNTTSISHSVTSVWLNLQRTGNPGTVTASIRYTSNSSQGVSCWSYPTGDDITYGTLDGDNFNTTYTWYKFDVTERCLSANTTYAIVLKTSAGNASNYVQWAQMGTGTYNGGNAGHSTDGGSTWVNECPGDNLFQIWGNPCISIESAKVFKSYTSTGDWLIVCHYKNFYEPYYAQADDVSQLFMVQLANSSGTVLAETPVKQWGYMPGSLYLSAAVVASYEWGASYRVRIYGLFSPNPYAEYQLVPADWLGSELTYLDSYCRSIAGLMQQYYTTSTSTYTLLTNVANRGLVLNETASVVFNNGIPVLSSVRPNLFLISTTDVQYTTPDATHALQQELIWQQKLGPQLVEGFTTLGNVLSVNGATGAALFVFILFVVVVSFSFAPGHAIGAIAICFPLLLIAWWIGVWPLVALMVILSIITLIIVYQMIFKGG